MLTIDNTTILETDQHRYSLRWYIQNEQAIPVLYKDGKRVVKKWSLNLVVQMDADPFGDNANCAS